VVVQAPEIRILVVAGTDSQGPIRGALARVGCAVVPAHTCAEALRSLQDSSFDIVVVHASSVGSHAAMSLAALTASRGIPLLKVGQFAVERGAELHLSSR
jgi:hypothetical protein